jgi:hypothetical protein
MIIGHHVTRMTLKQTIDGNEALVGMCPGKLQMQWSKIVFGQANSSSPSQHIIERSWNPIHLNNYVNKTNTW